MRQMMMSKIVKHRASRSSSRDKAREPQHHTFEGGRLDSQLAVCLSFMSVSGSNGDVPTSLRAALTRCLKDRFGFSEVLPAGLS